mgnify:CR=1 FL=1
MCPRSRRSKGNFAKQDFLRELKCARQWDGPELPPRALSSIQMLWDQFALFVRQIKDLEQQQRRLLREARSEGSESPEAHRKAAKLTQLRGIGDIGALTLVMEFFGWRLFANRKQVAALAGLTGTPH